MNHIEIEAKYEVSEDSFARLQSSGTVIRREQQLNTYYDCRWALASRSITFRIRRLHLAPPVITMKVPVKESSRGRVMRELEVNLSSKARKVKEPASLEVANDLPPAFQRELRSIGVNRLEKVGSIRNTRVVVGLAGLGEIDLDRVELPDGTIVYEVEIEHSNDAIRAQLVGIVLQIAPGARPSTLSKFQRFYEAAREINASAAKSERRNW